MKQYKHLLPLLPVLLLGVVGAFVRAAELTEYIDPSTNIYHATGIAAWALPIISLLVVAYALYWGLKYRSTNAESFLSTYGTNRKSALVLLIGSAVLVIAAGAMKVASVLGTFFEALSLLSVYSGMGFGAVLKALSVADLVYGLITMVAGASLLALTKVRYRRTVTDTTRFLATIPIFWTCFVLIMTFMEHPVEPVFQIFAYDLLGAAAIVLSVYNTTALLFGKMKLWKSVTTSLLSLYFIAVSVGGRVVAFLTSSQLRFLTEVPFRMIVFVAMFGYILVNIAAVLKNNRE